MGLGLSNSLQRLRLSAEKELEKDVLICRRIVFLGYKAAPAALGADNPL
jgi:hypothetical protein